MKVLIVGLGSIAQKHIAALKVLEPTCRILALRSNKNAAEVAGIENVYHWHQVPSDISFIIISNPSSEHFETIRSALVMKVPLFIEKPPLMNLNNAASLLEEMNRENIITYIAFNLRFHPAIIWLKENIRSRRVFEVQAYCGSYLPEWRKGNDYRTIYSAKKELGGGVHLDLIHELDYILWLWGNPLRIQSDRSKLSDLEISSVDSACYWLTYKNMRASIMLNYFRRDPRRSLEIVMDEDTWTVDLLKCVVRNAKGDEIFSSNFEITGTYIDQMVYFLKSLRESTPLMNDLKESLVTLKLCLNET
jgi:predicted dehydrogenase